MTFSLYIQEEAEADMTDAWLWYEEQKRGLGDEFLTCINDVLNRIAKNPKLYPINYKKHRLAVVRRFPFHVVYKVYDREVIVYAIYHTSRHPENKYRGD